MNLNTVENKEVNEGSENLIIVSRNQNDEAVGAALDEIRTAWVEHPSTPQLISHRHLFRYSQELTVMQITLREYAYSEDNNELDVVNAVFEYVTEHTMFILMHYTHGLKRQVLRSKKVFQYQPCLEYESCYHSIIL